MFFQLLDTLDLKSSSGIDRVEKVFSKLNWNSFPGVQSLLLKVRIIKSIIKIDSTKKETLESNHDKKRSIRIIHGYLNKSLFLSTQGLTCPATAEPTLGLLSKLTNLTTVAIVDPAPASGLSLNVIALLPKLILNFDEPDEFCKEAANNIEIVCCVVLLQTALTFY